MRHPCTATLSARGSTSCSAGGGCSPRVALPHLEEDAPRLLDRGDAVDQDAGHPGVEAAITYQVTEAGTREFERLMSEVGPTAWEDDNFDIRFASSPPPTWRSGCACWRAVVPVSRSVSTGCRASSLTQAEVDRYAAELQRHGVESVEREVRGSPTSSTPSAVESTAPSTAPSTARPRAAAGAPIEGTDPPRPAGHVPRRRKRDKEGNPDGVRFE